MKNHVTGIVLAGGKSSRMGEEKGLVMYQGKPMIEHVITVLDSVCDFIIISSNSDYYNHLSNVIVNDSILDSGPGSGIAAALQKSTTEVNVIVPCDMPNLNANFINYLVPYLDEFDGVVPVFENKIEPLCAVLNKGCFSAVNDCLERGILKLSEIYKTININYVEIYGDEPGFNRDLFKNYNSPKDF